MNFLTDAPALQVFGKIFGHQMPPVRRGVDQHILGRRGDRTVENDLQRLVACIAGVKGKIIAEDDEALRASIDQFNDIRQIGQVALFHLDHAQSLRCVFVEQRLDQR
ncbi:MAG: hypothetical protein AW09_003649 [Candidatus Accumulibacter phosphatis]|uniref:Uncharacterized protein n=1 Tax=Candidatus Accumulibacter phosphatis TaxID=327160 RepID=A0A080LSA2_9PROT|nr:MAG: hypothetical protein AW09_003649 [Candidatus Accumulibacter phosphatis]